MRSFKRPSPVKALEILYYFFSLKSLHHTCLAWQDISPVFLV